ncbi:unnamed protein product [Dovyalis caffra]|uniref:RING-type domain-containing protein n=1 Tax=Dovyalis caffra TaxID=77055 RepID=A0AAV1S508_9ROSI|nr:unnamed protein product [Dovyalis caffra]
MEGKLRYEIAIAVNTSTLSFNTLIGPENEEADVTLMAMAITGNVDAIKALCSEGANLEWIDKEGKTPLIVACMDSGLYNVAKVLIEMGANVNAYRPGRRAGTPLHHAVKRGLDQTVKLLLSRGANVLVRNDDCQTPLDVARIKGNINVVRIIELGCRYTTRFQPFNEFHQAGAFDISYFTVSRLLNEQDTQPRTIIALWKAKIEEPNFNQPDPELTIFDQSTKTQYKLASANEGDKQQLHLLYDACSGIPQVIPPPMHRDPPTTVPVVGHQTSAEAVESAMDISGSIQSATEDRPLHPNTLQSSGVINANGWEDPVHVDSHNGWAAAVGSTHSAASSSGWMDEAPKEDYNGWGVPNMRSSGSQAPSAPPIPDGALDEGTIHYPSIDFSPVDFSVPASENGASEKSDVNDGDTSSSCIICWEAPVEGACIPCGHMAGCMTCLNEIKAKKGVCPVCQSKINQVVRLYAV